MDYSKKLSSAGNAGSLAANGNEFGVFEGTIQGVPHPVAIKIYPAGKRAVFDREVAGARAAAKTGHAAQFYGEVNVGPGKLAFAMEKIEGGFPSIETLEQPGTPQYDADVKESNFYAGKVGQQTIQDVEHYGNELLAAGSYIHGDLQGLVDTQGRWRAMDFQGVRPLPADPQSADYQRAMKDHKANIEAQIKQLQEAAKRVQGGTP